MFTGLIEALGKIREIKSQAGGIRLGLITDLTSALSPGDSLAVNGVCLTVVAADADVVHMDVSPETMRVTTIGGLARGATVNLERPLRAEARIGGHFVQGHVDGTGAIEEIRQEGDAYWLTIRFPESLARGIVRKGSIAVDGISLTVAGVDEHRFDVQIIPFTWDHTNLHAAREGDRVNLETDILGKYVLRAMETRDVAHSAE
jgi:riboflavin synthase